jgi:HEAT repeat protein
VALKNNDVSLQQTAIWFMGRLGNATSESALLAVLDDHRPALRHAALHALSHLWGVPEVRHLASPRPVIVVRAAEWLGANEQPRSLRPLAVALREERFKADQCEMIWCEAVRAVAAIARRCGGQSAAEAVAILREFLNNRQPTYPSIASHVIRALHTIGTEEALAAAIVYQAEYRGSMASQVGPDAQG